MSSGITALGVSIMQQFSTRLFSIKRRKKVLDFFYDIG